MRIVKKDEEGLRVRIDSDDDLWTMSHICTPGSTLGMLGHRRDQTTGTQEGGRAREAERKPMWIVIDVGSNEFQPFTDALRVSGIIRDARIDVGSHHTHALKTGEEAEIGRVGGLSNLDLGLIEEAVAAGSKPRVILCVVESDEVQVFEIATHGLRSISSSSLRGGGKREKGSSDARRSFISAAAREVALLLTDETPVVICGPGDARVGFEKRIRESGGEAQIVNVATSIGGRAAANEVLGEGTAGELLGAHAICKQTRLIEEGLRRIATDGAVSYGRTEIANNAELGAVETLIIDAALLREGGSGGEWQETAAAVETAGGSVEQASTDHDAGAQLEGFGGAIALLRWRPE